MARITFCAKHKRAVTASMPCLRCIDERGRVELERQLGAHPRLIVTSAHSGQGLERLRAELAALAAAPGEVAP